MNINYVSDSKLKEELVRRHPEFINGKISRFIMHAINISKIKCGMMPSDINTQIPTNIPEKFRKFIDQGSLDQKIPPIYGAFPSPTIQADENTSKVSVDVIVEYAAHVLHTLNDLFKTVKDMNVEAICSLISLLRLVNSYEAEQPSVFTIIESILLTEIEDRPIDHA